RPMQDRQGVVRSAELDLQFAKLAMQATVVRRCGCRRCEQVHRFGEASALRGNLRGQPQCTYMRWRHPEDELASGFGLEHLAATVETYRILKASGADSRCRVPEHDVDRRGLPLQAAVFVLPPTSTRTRRISPCGLHPPASYPR